MTRLGWLSCLGVLVLVACSATNGDSANSKKSKEKSDESDDDDDSDEGDDDPIAGDDDPVPGDDDGDDTPIVPKADAAAEAGGSGAVCTFNRDCPTTERCECEEATGCFCHTGARGTGKNGVTECTTGNDCESALCIPGNDGKDYCSDECTNAAGCKSKLPLCSEIALLGKVCIRQKI